MFSIDQAKTKVSKTPKGFLMLFYFPPFLVVQAFVCAKVSLVIYFVCVEAMLLVSSMLHY